MKTENTQETKTTLDLGGTGKTGHRVVERLVARGVSTRVGSRSGEPPFDWDDRGTRASALRDVEAVCVSYYPDLAVLSAVAAVRSFAELAVEAGARRLVLLSGRGEEEAQRAERAVQETGAEWTGVRCAWFNQNFSENYLLEPVLGGEVVLPAGDVPKPFVDAIDKRRLIDYSELCREDGDSYYFRTRDDGRVWHLGRCIAKTGAAFGNGEVFD